MSEESFREVVNRLPTEWVCVDCSRSFPFVPGGEIPAAWRAQDGPFGMRVFRADRGQICHRCDSGETQRLRDAKPRLGKLGWIYWWSGIILNVGGLPLVAIAVLLVAAFCFYVSDRMLRHG